MRGFPLRIVDRIDPGQPPLHSVQPLGGEQPRLRLISGEFTEIRIKKLVEGKVLAAWPIYGSDLRNDRYARQVQMHGIQPRPELDGETLRPPATSRLCPFPIVPIIWARLSEDNLRDCASPDRATQVGRIAVRRFMPNLPSRSITTRSFSTIEHGVTHHGTRRRARAQHCNASLIGALARITIAAARKPYSLHHFRPCGWWEALRRRAAS